MKKAVFAGVIILFLAIGGTFFYLFFTGFFSTDISGDVYVITAAQTEVPFKEIAVLLYEDFEYKGKGEESKSFGRTFDSPFFNFLHNPLWRYKETRCEQSRMSEIYLEEIEEGRFRIFVPIIGKTGKWIFFPPQDHLFRQTKTDRKGRFQFKDVPSGCYWIWVYTKWFDKYFLWLASVNTKKGESGYVEEKVDSCHYDWEENFSGLLDHPECPRPKLPHFSGRTGINLNQDNVFTLEATPF